LEHPQSDNSSYDRLRHDPTLQIVADQKLGEALGSQPTLSRWENASSARDLVRLNDALLDQQVRQRGEILLDIDSTDDPLAPAWLCLQPGQPVFACCSFRRRGARRISRRCVHACLNSALACARPPAVSAFTWPPAGHGKVYPTSSLWAFTPASLFSSSPNSSLCP
jgi:hypothetical protein